MRILQRALVQFFPPRDAAAVAATAAAAAAASPASPASPHITAKIDFNVRTLFGA